MTTRIQPVLTIADLDVMPDDGNRYEIIEGELIVSRAPSLLHQIIISNIIALIRNYLDTNPIGIVVPGPGIMLNDVNGVIPDVVFVSDEKRRETAFGEKLTCAPELVIEILSPGAENERRDRVVKRQLYGRFGVEEYWIVDPANRFIEVYRLEEQVLVLTGSYTEQDEVSSSVLPGFRCAVQDIFHN